MKRVGIKTVLAGFTGLALVAAVGSSLSAAGSSAAGAAKVTWAPMINSIVAPSKNLSESHWLSYRGKFTKNSVDEHLDDPLLKGAIDIHSHFGPDAYDRQWDAFEIAKLAQQRGMRGIVIKNHWSESAGLAYLIRKHGDVPGLEVYGGLVLNVPEGGINPQAVRYFAEVEGRFGKVVWMPTHDSEKEVKFLKETRPYVVVSRNGRLLPTVFEVLDLIAKYKLTLATGHVSPAEMVQIVSEARRRGIEGIIITHPGLGPMFTDPTMDQLKQVTGMGAYAEVVVSELLGPGKAAAINTIRTLGAQHCIVSTDSGLIGTPNHPDAMVKAIRILREAGFSEAELNLLFRANPAKVLGLPVQS